MRITKDLHISFEFENSQGQKASIFIEYIDKRRFDLAAPILGKIYTEVVNGKTNPDVFTIDWPILLKDDIPAIDKFIDHLFNTGQIVSNGALINLAQPSKKIKDELEKAYIDDDVLVSIKGLLLFSCALLRYATVSSIKNVEGLFFTHSNVTDWKATQCLSVTPGDNTATASLEKI